MGQHTLFVQQQDYHDLAALCAVQHKEIVLVTLEPGMNIQPKRSMFDFESDELPTGDGLRQ